MGMLKYVLLKCVTKARSEVHHTISNHLNGNAFSMTSLPSVMFYRIGHRFEHIIASQNYNFNGYCLSNVLVNPLFSKMCDIDDFGS